MCFEHQWLVESQLDTTLPEAWLSSQRIIITDEQCKNTNITALSEKGIDTQ